MKHSNSHESSLETRIKKNFLVKFNKSQNLKNDESLYGVNDLSVFSPITWYKLIRGYEFIRRHK